MNWQHSVLRWSVLPFTFISLHAHGQTTQAQPDQVVEATAAEKEPESQPLMLQLLKNKPFLILGYNAGGDHGPNGKDLDRDANNTFEPSLNTKRYELGMGFNLTPEVALLVTGQLKNLNYSIVDDYSADTYEGRTYGLTVGPQYRLSLSDNFAFVTSVTGAFNWGKVEHPSYMNIPVYGYDYKTSTNKGEYKDLGLELAAGIDIRLLHNMNLGLMGRYGLYNINFKQGYRELDENISPKASDTIKSPQRFEVGLNLKFTL